MPYICDVVDSQVNIVQYITERLSTSDMNADDNTQTILGLYIDELVEAGVAFADGRLKPEDRILEINGQSVRDAPQEMVSSCLTEVTKRHLPLTKLLFPSPNATSFHPTPDPLTQRHIPSPSPSPLT